MRKKSIGIAIVASLAAVCMSCHRQADTPKPYAYLRIDVPQPAYHPCDTAPVPFRFEINDSAQLALKKRTSRDVWVDVVYPQFDGVLFLCYKRLTGMDDLRGQTDTSSRLLENHYQFASGVEERSYEDEDHRVFGTTYLLRGAHVASTYQFWVTDSLNHFLRGALYINRTPNNDSLAPVWDYLRTDVNHLIETLEWR